MALVPLVLYSAWLCRYLLRHSAVDLALIARSSLAQGRGASATIDALAPHAHKGGYDGEFALFIALDPFAAHNYLDAPTYRLGRIVYPLAARALAIGQPALVPLALVLVNVAAVVAGTFLLALLLTRHNVNPWLSLLFGASPAVFVSVDRDLTEPLAYALVIAALLVLDTGRFRTAALVFGLAGLTRETTLLFPLALLIVWAMGLGTTRRRLRELALFGCLSLGPYVVFRLALVAVLGHDPDGAVALAPYPFEGLVANLPLDSQPDAICGVLIPAFFALAGTVVAVRRLNAGTVALLVNVVFLVLLLPASSYDYTAAGRVTLGVILASVLCAVYFPPRLRPASIVPLSFAALLWLEPWVSWFGTAFLA